MHTVVIRDRESGESFEQAHDAVNACRGSEFAINHLIRMSGVNRQNAVVLQRGECESDRRIIERWEE